MKKLMALCLAMLMALSMVSFSVMAEGEAVSFADIANGQPAAFVTSNLVLGENVITSSNEEVIATDGTVTRPLFDDATVSLTINGGEAFDVVVKALTTNVLYSTDFSVDSGIESRAFTNYPGWSLGTDVKNTTEVKNGKLFADHGTPEADSSHMYIYAPTASGKVTTRPVTFTGTISDVAYLSTGIDIRISGDKYNDAGKKVGTFSAQTVMSMRSGNKFAGYAVGHTIAKNPYTLKYDPTTGDLWVNGTKANINLMTLGSTDAGETASSVKITNFLIVDASSAAKGQYNLDDYVVYEDVSVEDVLANSSSADQKVGYYSKYLEKDYVANGGSLDMLANNLKFTADEELVDGVSLSWTSSNPAVIAADGTVKRSLTETQTATITGTLTVEGALPVTKTYNVTVAPLTTVGSSEILDFEGIDEGVAIETTDGWKSGTASLTTTVAKEADGNSYLRVVSPDTTAYVSTARTYTFSSVPSVEGAEYIVMEAKVHVPAAWTSINASNITLNLNGTKAAEWMIGSAGYPGYIYGGALKTGNPWHTGSTLVAARTKIPTSDFVNLKIKINPTTGVVDYYQNGKRTGTVAYEAGTTAVPNLTTLNSASLYIAWRNAQGEYWLDDVKLYTEVSEDTAMKNLPAEEKVAFFKQLIEGADIGTANNTGAVLDLDKGYESYDLASYGISVNWASDDTAYITNDGTVAKVTAHGETKTVNMTATITAGEVTDTVVIPVAVGSETVLIASTDFSDTSVAINKATYASDEEHGSFVTMTNPTESTHKSTGTTTAGGIHGAGRYDRIIFEADMSYNDDGATYASGGIIVKTLAGKDGIQVFLNYTTHKVIVVTSVAKANAAATGIDAVVSETKYYQMPNPTVQKGEGAWVHVMVDHNVLSQTYNVYVDGVLVNNVPLLQAQMELNYNGGSAIRGYSMELSGKGTLCLDNVALYKYRDANAVEVNAALNAALVKFASDIQEPVLVNQELPAMTIGRSWVGNSIFKRDAVDTGTKDSNGNTIYAYNLPNISTYKYVEDGPAITYAIDGQAVTAVNVASPKTVQLTITASANGITESKTVTRKVAPVAIHNLSLGTGDCLNGAWVKGAKGTEKLIIARYLDGKLAYATVADFAVTEAWNPTTSTGDRYDEATGLVKNLSTAHPKEAADYDQVKIFIVAENGITPLAYVNADLKE